MRWTLSSIRSGTLAAFAVSSSFTIQEQEMKLLRTLFGGLAAALTMLVASPPALAVPLAAGQQVYVIPTEDFSVAYAPFFYSIGGGGGGVAGSTYTTSVVFGYEFWSSQLSIDSITLGANMFQIGDIAATLDFGGAMFAFTISGGVSDITTFILPARVHFMPADPVTLTWTCPAACIVGLNAQASDAHADTQFSFLTADAPGAAAEVPEPGSSLALALFALAMALLATMSNGVAIRWANFILRINRPRWAVAAAT